ncbi:NADH/ubiquinone/plastoquinone (complex i) [Luminiphilus syltensis NOR5-1B]|uniref:Probable inorganic carbon transporter subunit DabB n=1 Tax=Luminiphilus syltensis NOR5-1B TaxID=565045 RepID=B8KVC6_9GAMM|nr:NADH-quinone oxidoreductase subunit L [Luminiphilus syltensis]EED35131.1 NADH/ubiquinone/plastoquinone (complex i) [Luminiphilus syltensis NOR5-1B]
MDTNITDLVLITIPLIYLISAMLAPSRPPLSGWRLLQGANGVVILLTLFAALLPESGSRLFSTSAVSCIVLTLVAFIGVIITGYSAQYLSGESGEARFQRWLQLTLGGVSVVVTSNHLVVLIIAWTGISLSLHQLLMFYPERKRAALAAHKKFLFARLAELCLVFAAVLLYVEHHTFFISEILSVYSAGDVELSISAQLAALLIASAAMVKCAQFPMHGWLIQVVEAPTPVSALLHAGIINMGGFLIISMAPLMLQAELANWLLLIVAGFTFVGAALITMTRVSVKVLLAWSTVAQMGLMLVECAMGQYGLALLHLVAHSCYKAYAFLSSGSEVENFLRDRLAPFESPSAHVQPLFFLIAVAVLAVLIGNGLIANDASLWLLLFLFPLVLISERSSTTHRGSILFMLGVSAGLLLAYTLQKLVFNTLAPTGALPSPAQALWCLLLVSVLFVTYWLLRQAGDSRLTKALYRNLYAGFYLDEWATRATLALWPAQLPQRAGKRGVYRALEKEQLS